MEKKDFWDTLQSGTVDEVRKAFAFESTPIGWWTQLKNYKTALMFIFLNVDLTDADFDSLVDEYKNEFKTLINVPNYDTGLTVLAMSSSSDEFKERTSTLLTKLKGTINVDSGVKEYSPLSMAVQCGAIETVKILLDNGAKIKNCLAIDEHGWEGSLRLFAAGNGSVEIFKLLTDRCKRNPDDQDEKTDVNGRTALISAVIGEYEDVVKIDDYDDVNALDEWGNAACHYCANNLSMLKILSEKSNFDVTLGNAKGNTIAHLTVNPEVANWMCKKWSNDFMLVKNAEKQTPAEKKRRDVLDMIATRDEKEENEDDDVKCEC